MRTKNAVSLIGMVGKDAEVRLANGVPYARFSLATSTGGYKRQDGTHVPEKTQWHNIVAWRNLADFAGKWVKKGMKVAVDGMVTYGEYTDQQGRKVHTVEILANDMVLMSVPQSQQQPVAQAQPVPVQQGCPADGYGQTTQPQAQVQPQAQAQVQPQVQPQNNAGQGGCQGQVPFPPPAGSDGLPF